MGIKFYVRPQFKMRAVLGKVFRVLRERNVVRIFVRNTKVRKGGNLLRRYKRPTFVCIKKRSSYCIMTAVYKQRFDGLRGREGRESHLRFKQHCLNLTLRFEISKECFECDDAHRVTAHDCQANCWHYSSSSVYSFQIDAEPYINALHNRTSCKYYDTIDSIVSTNKLDADINHSS